MIMIPGRRPLLLPSKKFKEWHMDAMGQMAAWKSGEVAKGENGWDLKIIDEAKIEIIFYPPDRIRGDLTNKAESIMDLLVDCGVLRDDNWFLVGELVLRMGGVDRERPRAEIMVEKVINS